MNLRSIRRLPVGPAMTSGIAAIAMLFTPLAAAGQSGPVASPVREPVPVIGPKAFIDYFMPTPVLRPLSATAWGAREVGRRDVANGLEDATMKRWNYWDGPILRGRDGRYRMFASRWDQADGHGAWPRSNAVIAISDALLGPYRDQGLAWPADRGGMGHNITPLRLPDGRYAVVASETRTGDVFVSATIDGPWRRLGTITVDQSGVASLETPGDMPDHGTPKPWHGSNISLIVRPDGAFEIIQRSGQILVSRTGILGPYKVMGDSIYRGLPGLPQDDLRAYEDPAIWYSGGRYHVIVNHWRDRRAYHLISCDGIANWQVQGLAYHPEADVIRYTDGTINHWNKLERPAAFIENGHVRAISFSVIDIAKERQTGDNRHGSKVIVVPFDGAAMDRDLTKAIGGCGA
ncbi:hypothetical protein FHT00_002898 [Sphingomonas insulae]|nr:glycoside hydrolase family protein [Sphingomonas insulae]NIJ30925.1 hypothetical protein [Sphingomonas insulae]